MTVIPYAEWRPDTAELNSAYTGDILNVFAADGSYIPARGLQSFGTALAARPLGAILSRQLNGTIRIFAGTTTKLWLFNNTTRAWDDVSKPATTYNATTSSPWSFAQFGNFVIAVNQNDDPQVYELGVSAQFRLLGGTPPRAGEVKVWGDFVALMQLTSNLDRVQWSGLNNCEFWTPGTNNSDYQTFPDGGIVQSSTEATNPIIVQERAIRRGTFVPGSTVIFTFQKIHDLRGAKSARGVAARGAYAFYPDEGGFFQMGPDGSITPIGSEKIDRTIFGRMAVADIANIYGAVDPFFSRAYFAVSLTGSSYYDTILCHDWNLQRWTPIQAQISLIIPAATTGYTLEGLDSVSASLDSLPFSLDSKVWQGGSPVMAAFDSSNTLCFFSGSTLEATITTQEMGDVSGGVVRTTSTYPVVDTSKALVSIGIRFRRNDPTTGAPAPVTWLPEQIPSSNTGRVRKNARARFHRYKVRIPAGTDWNHCQGIDVATAPAGER